MAKAVKQKQVSKPVVTETKEITLQPESGILIPNDDEDSEVEFKGNISLSKPGEYWLNGFMKKATDGSVHCDLVAERKDEDKQPKAQLLDDRGVLFKNNRKRKKNQPDYTGNISVTTPGEYQLEATIQEKKGTTYMEILLVDAESPDAISEDEKFF